MTEDGLRVLLGILRRADPSHKDLVAKGLEITALLAETSQVTSAPPCRDRAGHVVSSAAVTTEPPLRPPGPLPPRPSSSSTLRPCAGLHAYHHTRVSAAARRGGAAARRRGGAAARQWARGVPVVAGKKRIKPPPRLTREKGRDGKQPRSFICRYGTGSRRGA
jgi:hypothetical protein